MKRKLIWLLLLLSVFLLALAGAYRIYLHVTNQPAESIDKTQARIGIPVDIVQALQRDLQRSVTVSGTIKAILEVAVTSTITERIAHVHADTGQRVTQGQLLITLDDTLSKLNLKQAQASLLEAKEILTRLRNGSRQEDIDAAKAHLQQVKADYKLREIELNRQKQLYQEQAASLQHLQDAQAAFDGSSAAVDAAEAQYQLVLKGPRQEDIRIAEAQTTLAEIAVEQAKNHLDDHYLKAPCNGVVSLRRAEAGDVVENNKPICKVLDTDKMYLELDVSELYISKLNVGMAVDVTVDALPGKTFTGKISQINPVANQSDRSYLTRIVMDNADGLLRSGMFARAKIIIGKAAQAVVIPYDAARKQGQQYYVLVKDQNNTAQRVDITAGELFDNMLEVTQGLSAGDEIITLGSDIAPGVKVIAPQPADVKQPQDSK
jgi:multidrug efflux pump subunit AcrA (membrane-fusion protein)